MKSDITDLKKTWDTLVASRLNNIPGVYVVDSGIEGPTVGITIMTHGNEPSGLAVARHFLDHDLLRRRLLKGKVLFVVNNLAASQQFWDCVDTGRDASVTRFVEINMNRLPDKSLDGNSCEEARARELLPVWRMFDYALDIHSTAQPTSPIAILGNGPEAEDLCRNFDLDKVLANMLNVQSGFPAIAFYGSDTTSTIGVEVGDHYNPQSLQRAIQISSDFLFSLGLIPKELVTTDYAREFDEKHLYVVYDKVILHHLEGRLTKIFGNFEPIKKGDVLATEPERQHVAAQDGYALFGLPQVTVKYPGEEALFLLSEKRSLSAK